MLETGHDEKKSMDWRECLEMEEGEMMEVQRAEDKKL